MNSKLLNLNTKYDICSKKILALFVLTFLYFFTCTYNVWWTYFRISISPSRVYYNCIFMWHKYILTIYEISFGGNILWPTKICSCTLMLEDHLSYLLNIYIYIVFIAFKFQHDYYRDLYAMTKNTRLLIYISYNSHLIFIHNWLLLFIFRSFYCCHRL